MFKLSYKTILIPFMVLYSSSLFGANSAVRELNTSTIKFTQVSSTPSNPSTGDYRIYIKSDGTLYKLNSSGAESAIGGGGVGGDYTLTTYTAGGTLSINDGVVIMDGSSTGGFNLTLPTAVGNSGKQLILKNITDGNSTINVLASGSETIDGASILTFSTENRGYKIYSDNANWKIESVTQSSNINVAQVDGSSGTPSITKQNVTWIDSVSDTAVGRYTLNFTSGLFTATPYCVCTAGGGGTFYCATNSYGSSTALEVDVFRADATHALADERLTVYCTTGE